MARVTMSPLVIGERYTRPELAELWGYAGFQALAKGVVTPARHDIILLFVTHVKQEALTQYQDVIVDGYLYWEGETGHRSDSRVANAHERGEEIHLFYRDIHHSPFQYRGPLEIRRYIPHTDRPSEFTFKLVHDLGPADDVQAHAAELEGLDETQRQAVIEARIGQGGFRKELLKMWRSCAVTAVAEPALLRASHIKPWRKSSNSERLDPHNGLLLVPQYDHLFDRGFVTFSNEGQIIISEAIKHIPTDVLGVSPTARLRRIGAGHSKFLEFHRDVEFVSKRVALPD